MIEGEMAKMESFIRLWYPWPGMYVDGFVLAEGHLVNVHIEYQRVRLCWEYRQLPCYQNEKFREKI
jgi:hypothetical protein